MTPKPFAGRIFLLSIFHILNKVASKNHSASYAQSDFFVRSYRNFAVIAKQEFAYMAYVKKFMCKMTENLQAYEVLRL